MTPRASPCGLPASLHDYLDWYKKTRELRVVGADDDVSPYGTGFELFSNNLDIDSGTVF